MERTSFAPSEVTVRAGETLTLVNDDIFSHTFTIDDAAIDVALAPDESASTTAPTKAGRYDIRCRLHKPMRGVLVVGWQ